MTGDQVDRAEAMKAELAREAPSDPVPCLGCLDTQVRLDFNRTFHGAFCPSCDDAMPRQQKRSRLRKMRKLMEARGWKTPPTPPDPRMS